MTTGEMVRARSRIAQRYPLHDYRLALAGRAWKITAALSEAALLDSVETEADMERFPFGLLLWPSAIALAECLAEQPELVVGRRALEVGTGVGLPGLVARSLGASVVQTDHQKIALDLARINAHQNGVEGILYLLADWRSFPRTDRCSLLLGSDVLYDRAFHPDLLSLFERMLSPGGLLLLTDPLRPPAFEFADRLEKEGWHLKIESRMVEWEEERKEIAVYCAQLKRSVG